MIKYNDKIKTQVYRIPTHSDRYLNFLSHNSIDIKRSAIRNLVSRAVSNTSDKNDLDMELKYSSNYKRLP